MHGSAGPARLGMALATAMSVAACGGGSPSPTPAPPTAGPTSGPASAGPATAGPTATNPSTGAPGLDAPTEVQAGVQFEVAWTGPNAEKDYVTIVTVGATAWTNEPYFYTTAGSPGKLTAPPTDGGYELWYVSGADAKILARRPITVTPFRGDLLAAESVMAGSQFDVAWNGPNGPGDYVTVVKAGATTWTNESYFYTTVGSPGKLTAGIEPGDYEIWYVIGSDSSVKARRPIKVTAYVVTLEAPREVARNSQFQVTWTGPDGPSDYITIVPAGSPPNTYLAYAYTASGNPVTITAPADPGDYEIWYASDRVKDIVFGRIPIKIN